MNRRKTFLDKVTASDIAYTILVYENTKDLWEEDLQIKSSSRTDKERRNAMHHNEPKYHVGRGKHLKRFGNGWTDNGQEYNQKLLRIFKELKSSDVWNTVQDHWNLYQKKHYARDVNQVEDVGTLPKGYIHNVPLPRVPLRQSAQSCQVYTIPDYYDAPYVVPMYDTPCSLVESVAYAFSPAWHAISINT